MHYEMGHCMGAAAIHCLCKGQTAGPDCSMASLIAFQSDPALFTPMSPLALQAVLCLVWRRWLSCCRRTALPTSRRMTVLSTRCGGDACLVAVTLSANAVYGAVSTLASLAQKASLLNKLRGENGSHHVLSEIVHIVPHARHPLQSLPLCDLGN